MYRLPNPMALAGPPPITAGAPPACASATPDDGAVGVGGRLQPGHGRAFGSRWRSRGALTTEDRARYGRRRLRSRASSTIFGLMLAAEPEQVREGFAAAERDDRFSRDRRDRLEGGPLRQRLVLMDRSTCGRSGVGFGTGVIASSDEAAGRPGRRGGAQRRRGRSRLPRPTPAVEDLLRPRRAGDARAVRDGHNTAHVLVRPLTSSAVVCYRPVFAEVDPEGQSILEDDAVIRGKTPPGEVRARASHRRGGCLPRQERLTAQRLGIGASDHRHGAQPEPAPDRSPGVRRAQP